MSGSTYRQEGKARLFAVLAVLAICCAGFLSATGADRLANARTGIPGSEFRVTAVAPNTPVELRALYQADNGPNRFRAYFTETGIHLVNPWPEEAPWGELELSLGGYTYRGDFGMLPNSEVTADGNRLDYVFSDRVRGTSVNEAAGIRQSFVLSGAPYSRQDGAAPIALSFSLAGDLTTNVQISQSGRTIQFVAADGSIPLHYTVTSATSASGESVPVSLEAMSSGDGNANGVRMLFEISDDAWPVTVEGVMGGGSGKKDDRDLDDLMKVLPASLIVGTASGDPGFAPPANDTCGGAIAIPAGTYPVLTTTVSLVEATIGGNPGADPTMCITTNNTVWYTFVPAVTSAYKLTTCQVQAAGTTTVDTVLGVFTSTGACAGPFTSVGCNDEDSACAGGASRSTVTVNMTAGTTYYVMVGSYSTSTPLDVQIAVDRIVAPANDTCAGAVALALDTPTNGTNTAATNDYQIGTPSATCFTGIVQTTTTAVGRDSVYSFTAPSGGSYSFRAQARSASGGGNLVLYTAPACPTAPPTQTITCDATVTAANRNSNTAQFSAAEEIMCLAMTAGQTLYLYVDESTASTTGGDYVVEVNRCTRETEANGTPATANSLVCGLEGSIAPAADVDFFALGSPAAGSRVFTIADGVSGNSNDFDMRITDSANTLEYDDAGNTTPWGSLSPNCAGTPLTGVASFIRMSHFSATTQSEPYRLYSIVQPPGGGLGGSSAVAETEPNCCLLSQANVAPNNFFSGTITPGGTTGDLDLFAFAANAGDLIMLNIDGDPLRNNTPADYAIFLFDSNGSQLLGFTDAGSTSSTVSGAGSLTATTPNSPAEAITWRARYSGVYYAAVNTQSTAQTGDYLYSISVNCLRGDELQADLAVTKSGLPDPVVAGQNISYTVTVTNNGPNAATNVTWTDTFPPNTTFVSLNGPAGWTCSAIAGGISCTSQGLGANIPQVFTLVLNVPQCYGNGPITNLASVTSLTTDPAAGNNSVSATTNVTDPRTCDDGSFCTSGDTCVGTVCQGGPPPPCDDGDNCTINFCNPATGLCENPPIVCDDSNPCTDDACDPANGLCVFTPDDTNPCTDNSLCTSDACVAGQCVSTVIVVCDDSNQCTDDVCDPLTGLCVFTIDDTNACSDGDACTVDICTNGTCVSQASPVTLSGGGITIPSSGGGRLTRRPSPFPARTGPSRPSRWQSRDSATPGRTTWTFSSWVRPARRRC